MITLSYELSLIEGKVGTPERPLSDLGKQSYLSWWTQRIIVYLKNEAGDRFSIDDMSKATGIMTDDIMMALKNSKLTKSHRGEEFLCTDPKVLDNVYKQCGRPSEPIHKELLHWYPFKLTYYEKDAIHR